MILNYFEVNEYEPIYIKTYVCEEGKEGDLQH
jgi:hypothetical protein